MISDVLQIDQQHVWHPYTSMIDRPPMWCVESARGTRIRLADGRELIDGMSSWWTAIHGYNHPHLNAAANAQLERMSHVMFGGLTHRPAAELCQRLVAMTPDPLQTVFLADSGSVAVEVAIKMAIQYWQTVGRPEKHRLLTIRHGYHGDTFGAMSVCDPETGMHHLFAGILPTQDFADAPPSGFDRPWNEDDIASMRKLIETQHAPLAAVILEPIVQGAGGMRFYSPRYLTRVRQLCDEFDVLLIADEIATGFGRTGKLFACEHAPVSPDIMCVGKSLTGGYLTLSATLTNRRVSDGISNEGRGIFMHGPTYMANPLACAIANANLELLETGAWRQQVANIQEWLRIGLEPCRNMPSVADVRVLGGIGVVEMHQPIDLRLVQPRLVELGVWLRPFGKLIYTMPPYVVRHEEVNQITAAIREVTRGLR